MGPCLDKYGDAVDLRDNNVYIRPTTRGPLANYLCKPSSWMLFRQLVLFLNTSLFSIRFRRVSLWKAKKEPSVVTAETAQQRFCSMNSFGGQAARHLPRERKTWASLLAFPGGVIPETSIFVLLVAILPGTWQYSFCVRTGWPGARILSLGKIRFDP